MSKYEVKLVNIGEEVDNRIRELEIELKDIRKRNDSLEFAKKHYKKHYLRLAEDNTELRKEHFGVEVATLNKEIDDLKEQIKLHEENEDANGDRIEKLAKENERLHKACHLNEVIELRKRNAFLEKLHSQHRYVFSEIPNTEENMKMVKLMKKHINKDRYTVRWRGQYLIDGEDWKKYTDGQPMNKSKCIRVYIDSKGDDTTEGFKESEVDAILEGLDLLVERSQEFVNTWEDKSQPDDEDITHEKRSVKIGLKLLKYFNSMKIHLEESKLARAEVTNNVT